MRWLKSIRTIDLIMGPICVAILVFAAWALFVVTPDLEAKREARRRISFERIVRLDIPDQEKVELLMEAIR